MPARLPKIVIGQSDSHLSQLLHVLVLSGDYEIHIAERGDRVLEISRIGTLPDLVILETSLRGPEAKDVCSIFRQDPKFENVPVLIVDPNGMQTDQSMVQGDGLEPMTASPQSETLIARVKSLIQLKQVADGQDDAESVLQALARTIEAKDPHTLGHADRVAHYAVALGKQLGVDGRDAQVLRKGGMLHDIGKIAIPDAILLKPGRYTQEEFAVMKQHPSLGCEICGKLQSMKDALPLIRHHHEKLDGTGYPDGLKGDMLSPLVRVVSIVDIYDALRSQRSYKEPFSLDKSFEIMWQEADKGWWDKSILKAWESLIRSSKETFQSD